MSYSLGNVRGKSRGQTGNKTGWYMVLAAPGATPRARRERAGSVRQAALAAGLWCLIWILAGPAMAQGSARIASIESGFWGNMTVTLEVDAAAPYRAFVVADPPRAVIDLKTRAIALGDLPPDARADRVEAGRLDDQWSRLIVHLKGPMTIETASLAEGQLQVQLRRASGAALRKAAQRAPGAEVVGALAAPEAPVEDGRIRIVLDPGHGGIDPGAVRDGVREKDLTLAFARDLAAALEATGAYDVHLTRRKDRYVLLDDRVAYARAANAALFLSLHANTVVDGDPSGAVIYVRAENASDPQSAMLAVIENQTDRRAGLTSAADDVTHTLLDLARPTTERRARMAAKHLVTELQSSRVTVAQRPLRAADFRVLRAPDMPSLLLEIGFLSNDGDRERMQTPEWRKRVATSVANALDAWRVEDDAFLALMQQ